MKNAGAKIRPEYEAFHKMREKESYNYKLPSLTNQTKESFFSAAHGVHYTWDHDSLHQAVRHLDMPAYKYYAKDNDPIKSDKDKFFSCSPEIRMYGAIEEGSVLGFERALCNNFDKWTLQGAWQFAISKISTSITSGFFRKWVFDNIFDVLKNYPSDYYEKVQRGIKNGIVLPVTNSNSMQM
jgi:hypothetical protein